MYRVSGSVVKLERIVPGSRPTGVIGDGEVEILSARTCGPDAVEVIRRRSRGRSPDPTRCAERSAEAIKRAASGRRQGGSAAVSRPVGF